MHISGGKHLFDICGKFSVFRFDICALIEFDTECFGNIALTAKESCRDKAKFTRDNLLAALYFARYSPAAFRISLEFQLYCLYGTKAAVFVLDKFLDRCLVDPRVAAEYCCRFFRIVFSTLIGKLWHHFYLNH